MKRKNVIVLAILTVLVVSMLTGCGFKNIDKMTDQELYNYMNENYASEDALDSWLETLTSEQQERAMVVSFTYGLAEYASEESSSFEKKLSEREAEKQRVGVEINKVLGATYEKSELWNTIDATVPAVQFCDIVVWEGMSADELESQLSSSALNTVNNSPYDGIFIGTSTVQISDNRDEGYGTYRALWVGTQYKENENGLVEYDELGNITSPMVVHDFRIDGKGEAFLVYQQNLTVNEGGCFVSTKE